MGMSLYQNINLHDEIAWGPNGRASDVPITDRGPNPLNEEAAEGADTPPRGQNPEGEEVNVPVFPNPDVAQLKRFHAALFKNADGGWLLFRAFEHGEQKPLFSANTSIHTGDQQLISVISERALQAAVWPKPAVFCPPVATFTTGKNATGANLFNGLTLSAECDETPNAAREKLTGLLGEPTIAAFSGGEWANPDTGEIEPKVHLHWRLETPTRTPQGGLRKRVLSWRSLRAPIPRILILCIQSGGPGLGTQRANPGWQPLSQRQTMKSILRKVSRS
jgi:hypothetical protein